MTLGRSSSGAIKIKTVDGLRAVNCACCQGFQMNVNYSWAGTGQRDLDTSTRAFGGSIGYFCADYSPYLEWITGDDTSENGSEQVDIRVDDARRDGLWSSSYNILAYAGWFEPAGGSGPAQLIVTYKGSTKSKSISPGSQSGCASTQVGTITVYSTRQPDGSFFDIL